ncbi:hypothetical protein GWI33_002155 [Rhynchophorus ferrugineus]|uniref:Uncharacterized protein n=1 Tax=Rhynchophorus ferrugineus TaxID=354439 RepID=A0A834MGJ1_RHYFE|nr:hypothetical protein GWI33_002155 [Rhynchophorus ferrugineus]
MRAFSGPVLPIDSDRFAVWESLVRKLLRSNLARGKNGKETFKSRSIEETLLKIDGADAEHAHNSDQSGSVQCLIKFNFHGVTD